MHMKNECFVTKLKDGDSSDEPTTMNLFLYKRRTSMDTVSSVSSCSTYCSETYFSETEFDEYADELDVRIKQNKDDDEEEGDCESYGSFPTFYDDCEAEFESQGDDDEASLASFDDEEDEAIEVLTWPLSNEEKHWTTFSTLDEFLQDCRKEAEARRYGTAEEPETCLDQPPLDEESNEIVIDNSTNEEADTERRITKEPPCFSDQSEPIHCRE